MQVTKAELAKGGECIPLYPLGLRCGISHDDAHRLGNSGEDPLTGWYLEAGDVPEPGYIPIPQLQVGVFVKWGGGWYTDKVLSQSCFLGWHGSLVTHYHPCLRRLAITHIRVRRESKTAILDPSLCHATVMVGDLDIVLVSVEDIATW